MLASASCMLYTVTQTHVRKTIHRRFGKCVSSLYGHCPGSSICALQACMLHTARQRHVLLKCCSRSVCVRTCLGVSSSKSLRATGAVPVWLKDLRFAVWIVAVLFKCPTWMLCERPLISQPMEVPQLCCKTLVSRAVWVERDG